MFARSVKSDVGADLSTEPAARIGRHPRGGFASALALDKIGAVYIWVLIAVIFSFWAPETFPTVQTFKQVLNSSAVTALASLALVIPLAAGVFDLSFAYTMTLSGVVAVKLVTGGTGVVPSVGVAMLVAIGIGLINAVVVVVAKIDAFIGTLATGSLILAMVTMITGGSSISGAEMTGPIANIGQAAVGGFTLPILYCALIALGIWFLLEHTATGRRLYATGFNPDASRLAGIRVNRLRFLSLVASSTIAGFAGVVLASTLGAGSPSAGVPYLLPAFAATFVGATQLKHGRFNAWGTIIAVLLLGTGTTGLALAAAPPWSPAMFVGVVLLAALGVTGLQRRSAASRSTPAGAAPAAEETPSLPHHDSADQETTNLSLGKSLKALTGRE